MVQPPPPPARKISAAAIERATLTGATALSPQQATQRYGQGAGKRKSCLAIDVLKARPKLLSAMQALEPGFSLSAIGTSTECQAVRLASGREILLIQGCTSGDCGGTSYWIASEEKTGALGAIKESGDPT